MQIRKSDFSTYQKALSLDVSSQKEHEFDLELEKELEESKLKQDYFFMVKNSLNIFQLNLINNN